MSASPNKEYLATVYIVWGGGAAGYVYRLVNIRKRSDPFDPKKGIVFYMTGATDLNLEWENNEHLIVTYSKLANVYTQAKAWGDKGEVQISYVAQ